MTRALRLVLALIFCSATAPAIAQDRCAVPGMMSLVVATYVLDLACEELAPERRSEREQVIKELSAAFPDCFAKGREHMEYFRKQAKATAERIRQAREPPESTTCLEFPARIRRVREVNGLLQEIER